MKTIVNVEFYYRGFGLRFRKEFDLPFTPFYNMTLYEGTIDEEENIIRLENSDYCKTFIIYDATKNLFDIDVHNIWKAPIAEDVIDDVIEVFRYFKWERTDTTDIPRLKDLMRDTYEKSKR